MKDQSQDRDVFIVYNDSHRDFYKAQKFGNLINVMDSGYDALYRDTGVMIEYIQEKMQYYVDDDYILMVGEPTLCALVLNVAIGLSESKRVNILRWDKIMMQYVPLCVDFGVLKDSQNNFKL